MRVIHIINSLEKGGAEGNLYRLCTLQKKKYKNKIEIIIITLINKGYYNKSLQKNGIKIISLNLSRKNQLFNFIKKVIKLRNIIKVINPDIIQTWMYHSNFISLFIPKKYNKKTFWNIRHSELNLKISKKMTIFLSLICGIFSRIIPIKIIYCSEKSIKFHENIHCYSKKRSILINNGYNENTFYPSDKFRKKFRRINKINKNSIILGFAGRFAKQKNIESMLHAFSKLIKNHKNIYLYMVGRDINYKNEELVQLVSKYQINNKVIFLNEQKNLLEFYNGIDLLLLTSHSESFPNVIAEAMLCSTPVLSSDAGCSKKIIGNNGFVLNKNDYISIFRSLSKAINLFIQKRKKWNFLKLNSRLQIRKNYSIEQMEENYLRSWIF